MPIQVDHSRPVRTYDASGKLVSTNSNEAAPVKNIDTAGRTVDALAATADIQKTIKNEAQQVAEKAAASLPNFANGQTSVNSSSLAPPEENQGQAANQAQPDDEKVTEAKIRREYLEAQRIKRQAQEMEKKAKTNLQRAEAFEKARAMAENGEDPTALLRAANLDPVKFYRDLTTYALSDKGKQEETDPVKKELAEHKRRLEAYEKEREETAKQVEQQKEIAAHNQVISEKVIPLLKDNSERYETIIAHYGQQAAVEVYKNCWEIYQQTGKARSFQEVADEMEKYWSDVVETGLNNALKLKKFQNRFAQSGNEAQRYTTAERTETPQGSITLSNKQQITATPTKTNPYRGLTKEERVAAILKKFDK